MRAVLQRVRRASVSVNGEAVGSTGSGLLVLLGVARGDTEDDAAQLASKAASLRIFEDDAGKMNRSVLECGASALVVSQFTLLADCRKGRRPSFVGAAPPDEALRLCEAFASRLREQGLAVETGRFGAHMLVSLENDGPVTIVLDSAAPAGAEPGHRPCGLLSGLVAERPFVLASGSPRRRAILAGLSVPFDAETTGVPEGALDGEAPEEHVERLARAKANAAARARSAGTVLGADTIVVVDGAILGKPADPDDAARMLRTIRGRWHEVFTGLSLIRCSDRACAAGHERTRVLVRDLSDAEVLEYVAGGEPLDKAGAYAIQGCGAAVVERVEGCFYNVVGLPVALLIRLLRDLAARKGALA